MICAQGMAEVLTGSPGSICTKDHNLAFTRYCFPSKLYCGSPPSVYPPPRLHSIPYCSTIARPLGNIRPLTAPPFVCRELYNIGEGNIVYRPNHRSHTHTHTTRATQHTTRHKHHHTRPREEGLAVQSRYRLPLRVNPGV